MTPMSDERRKEIEALGKEGRALWLRPDVPTTPATYCRESGDAIFSVLADGQEMRKWESHAAMVEELHKRATKIQESLTPPMIDLWHATTGVVTEAGELMSTVKAHVIYLKPLDMENVVEELGDLEFYLEQFRQNVGVTRTQCLEANMHKLGIRYAEGFSNEAAQARADKAVCGKMDAFSPSGCKNEMPCATHPYGISTAG